MAEVEASCMKLKHQDVKGLSKPTLDLQMSQQKRRELLLESQKSRRDEILEKLRHLDDSDASESEAEDVDFVENMILKRRENEITNKYHPGKASNNGDIVDHHVGRNGANKHQSEKMGTTQAQGSGRGRGRGRGRDVLTLSNADKDQNWRSSYVNDGENRPNAGHRRHKRPAPYGIMLSEWLVDIPEDFQDSWFGVLCPVGRRCIVVACKGKTKAFTRRNNYLGQFASCLPGGSKSSNYYSISGNRRRGLTILDCIWSDKTQMFYVLDLICWNSHSVNNCPTDLRHFLLLSKFQETPELSETTQQNAVPFMPLPFFNVENLASTMTTTYPAFPDEIDGVLFYHKNVFYVPEVTPLCLWAHLSDIPLLLSLDVNPDLLARERAQNPKARYYLDKPIYKKNITNESASSMMPEQEIGEYDTATDEVPLG